MDAHYSCRECYHMHDPCEECWVLIDNGTHPQQPQNKQQKEKINKMKLHWRTELYMRVIVPLRVYARNKTIYLMENAIDRLDLENSRRYDNAVSFREFIMDDDLFTFDDDDYNY